MVIESEIDPKWTQRDPVLKLSFKTKRLLLLVLLPAVAGAWVNDIFDLYLFRGFDKQVVAVVTVALFAVVSSTSQEEFRQYREQADVKKYGEIKDRTWQQGLLLVLFLFLMVLYFLWDEFKY